MKVTIYELFGMIKDGKAPKKIIIDGGIYNLRTGKGTSYEFGSSGAMLCFDYYIENNKLDTIIEITEEQKEDKKIEITKEQKEDKKIEKIEYSIDKDGYLSVNDFREHLLQIINKINEIIDYIMEDKHEQKNNK